MDVSYYFIKLMVFKSVSIVGLEAIMIFSVVVYHLLASHDLVW